MIQAAVATLIIGVLVTIISVLVKRQVKRYKARQTSQKVRITSNFDESIQAEFRADMSDEEIQALVKRLDELGAENEAIIQPVPSVPSAAMPPSNVAVMPTVAPATSFSLYVRTLTEQIVTEFDPSLLKEVQALADRFLARMKSDGARPMAPAVLSGDEKPDGLSVLSATYVTTRRLTSTLSPDDIEEQFVQGTLAQTLRQQAEEAARQQKMAPPQAQAFAEQYVRAVSRNLQTLQELASK